jgi:hypothetical protein
MRATDLYYIDASELATNGATSLVARLTRVLDQPVMERLSDQCCPGARGDERVEESIPTLAT